MLRLKIKCFWKHLLQNGAILFRPQCVNYKPLCKKLAVINLRPLSMKGLSCYKKAETLQSYPWQTIHFLLAGFLIMCKTSLSQRMVAWLDWMIVNALAKLQNSTQVLNSTSIHFSPWWRHQMETFSALLALCAGNSPVTGEFPSQRPVTRSFDVFIPPPNEVGGGYTGFTLSVRPSVRPSVCRRHGFRSISQGCFGISISNFICMLMVAIGRSLLIFSDVS